MEALSADIDRKLKALVRAGYYSSKLEAMKMLYQAFFGRMRNSRSVQL